MTPTSDELARFARMVAAQLGLRVDADRASALIERRAASRGESIASYVRHVDAVDPAELRTLASELTVGETYFLRHIEQFRAFIDIVAPDRLARGPLRVLSAGCSSGEEPYTLAMLLRESYPAAPFAVHAIDINVQAIARARAGRYSRWSLRAMAPEFEKRWFCSDGRDAVVRPEARAGVTFDVANLFERHQGAVAGPWDVVFCRNVIMYFTDEQAHAAVTRLARSLTPGGYLFLGHAETLRNRSADFELCHTHGAFYYQRRPAAPSHIAVPRADPTDAAPELEAAWYEDIHAASERVRALVDVALDPAQARRASDERTAAQANLDDRAATPANLDEIRELLVEERFSEALAALDRRIAARSVSTGTAHHADRDIAMLRALVLTHSGRFPEARAACADLLAIDATSAGANYLLALCCDSRGDPDGAAQHAQIAAKLDPSFAMPRVHLGLLARRAGDRDLAARELTRAIDLLEREPPARLALYGGGFSRQALLGMCRAELTAIGAPR